MFFFVTFPTSSTEELFLFFEPTTIYIRKYPRPRGDYQLMSFWRNNKKREEKKGEIEEKGGKATETGGKAKEKRGKRKEREKIGIKRVN